MNANELEKRILEYRQRWSAAPKSRAFAPLADALRQAGQYDEALELLENGLVLHPEFQAAMVIMGLTLVAAEQQDHGRKVLQTVLKMDADNLVALDWLIEDACARSAWEEAVPLLEHVVIVEPDSPRWQKALAKARQDFAPKPAPKPAAKSAPESFATMTLVDIYIAQGYHGKAREALLRIQKHDPDRPGIAEKLTELAEALPDDDAVNNGAVREVRKKMSRQQQGDVAARRASEKKKFADWLGRIEADESAAP